MDRIVTEVLDIKTLTDTLMGLESSPDEFEKMDGNGKGGDGGAPKDMREDAQIGEGPNNPLRKEQHIDVDMDLDGKGGSQNKEEQQDQDDSDNENQEQDKDCDDSDNESEDSSDEESDDESDEGSDDTEDSGSEDETDEDEDDGDDSDDSFDDEADVEGGGEMDSDSDDDDDEEDYSHSGGSGQPHDPEDREFHSEEDFDMEKFKKELKELEAKLDKQDIFENQDPRDVFGRKVREMNQENQIQELFNIIQQIKEKKGKVPLPTPVRRTLTGKPKAKDIAKGFQRNDGRYFAKQGGNNNRNSKGQKTYLCLVIDKSGSMSPNELLVNKMLYTMYRAYLLVPDVFDYDIILIGDDVEHIEKTDCYYATEGNRLDCRLSEKVLAYRRKHPDADCYTLLMFDGNFGWDRRSCIKDLTDKNTTWISDPDNEDSLYQELGKGSKQVKILSNYVEELIHEVCKVIGTVVNKI